MVNMEVFSMDVENFICKLPHDTLVINHLQDQMRWIKVQPKVIIGNDLPHLAPDFRRACQVVTARPLIVREDHRAVLDGNLNAIRFSELDDRRPNLGIIYQILRNGLVLIFADESTNNGHLQHICSLNHLLQVRNYYLTLLDIWMERIRIIRERRDCHAVVINHLTNVLGLSFVQFVNIDMRNTRITAGGFLERPASNLDSLETAFSTPLGSLFKCVTG